MSDYFSVKPIPSDGDIGGGGGSSGTNTPGSSQLPTPSYSLAGSTMNTDNASIHSSGSQYLMDMIPDSLTLKDNATYSHINTKDFILPKSDVRSPYYIAVPIPNPLATAALNNTSLSENVPKDNTDEEGYFVREFPTDILIDRFYKWKKILKSIIAYLREVAYAQEQFARVNHQIKGSIKFPFLTDLQDGSNKVVDPLFATKLTKKQQPLTLAQQKEQKELELQKYIDSELENQGNPLPKIPLTTVNQATNTAASGFMQFGSGSIQDIQVILKKHHLALATQQFKVSKEITSVLIPKLESLRKDLSFKIKEIKELHSDFKTNIKSHIKLTSHLLNKYIAAIKFVNKGNLDGTSQNSIHLHPKHDPFLLKLQLDLQLKRQLSEENYLQEAYINLQTTGLKLEKIIYAKIQHSLQRYSSLIDAEARLMIKNLCQELQHGMLSKPPALEWDHFVSHHPLCLMDLKSNDPLPRPRKLSDIVYPNMKASMSKCIRAGYFEKKSNFTKGFKKGYFVLTPNYLHEFKSSDFFNNPEMSSTNTSGYSTPSMSVSSSSAHLSNLGDSVTMTSLPPNSNLQAVANGKAINSKKVNSLTPILSIPLNECTLTEYTESSFTLMGKATFIELEKRKPAGNLGYGANTLNQFPSNGSLSPSNMHTSSSAASLNPLENESAKYITKKSASALSKLLLKPVRGKQAKQKSANKKEVKRQQEEYNRVIEKESNHIVTWVFKSAQEYPTEEEKKHFKKWILDLKNLCTFNTTRDRLKFIDEKIGKIQNQRVRGKHHHTSSVVDPNTADTMVVSEAPSMFGSSVMLDPSLNSTSNSLPAPMTDNLHPKSPRGTNKPNYIPIENTAAMDLNADFRSRINTPMIDDNGNLITLAEKKPAFVKNGSVSSFGLQTLSKPVQSPTPSNGSDQYYMNSIGSGSDTVPNVSITSNGVNIRNSSQPLQAPSNRHQRNISLPSTLGVLSPGQSPSDLSMVSDNSQGGYFAIPVRKDAQPDFSNQTANQAPVSLYNEDQIKQTTGLSLSRTSSRGLRNSRKPSASSIQTANLISVPKVHVNNQEVKAHPTLPRGPPILQKQLSTGSLPSMVNQVPNNELQPSGTATPPATTNGAPLYQKGNGSATNLGTATPTGTRVHSYRKHKKNVSFGSLNSLMFSKKSGAYAYSSGNLMNGGILEDEDSEDGKSTHGSIKLNQSIYQ
ncbi:similar to Saccharomyces cerevisiae YGR097W ASK10 Component of RNA polymerase II holoenzyme, phosphorylated in response to oxidative stress [Maudiozyma saulgeensis]|uniref:Similar to Saccharomyces cerevisiae YGR097W ASK10 Component of RNA polymerase II holoenzyme, phosphorylated in response to oxidative stress n=1 Tax=Maudiozyma saulgeensis TaxID=1789683 RepID=A0A1X7QX12_9SACH|nr:similar to Saccharomyces cerevisiae YGR097W ASK10 Component of RNA polymerase II holoenzyme, phosphorylated in response to oxidative stress [Kazachstania saulgeensis]